MRRLAFTVKAQVAGRDSLAAMRDFHAADAMAEDDLERVGRERASAQARFALAHSPFYRDFYASHGVRAADLADPQAFDSLPIVDKSMLRENFDSIRTDEATDRTSVTSKTGGSTGAPLHILRDVRFPARALEWRLFHWWQVAPWEDRGIVTRHMLSGLPRIRHDLGWLPSRRVQLDAFQITDESVAKFARAWNRIQPPVMVGYGGGILDMARRLRRLGIEFAPPRAIAVTAAPLTAGTREEIESSVGGKCYDHYRSAEVPWIAGECAAQDGLHVFSDVRRVEIIDPNGHVVTDGTEGEVVVSDLTNRVFPILRYRLGDISSLMSKTCACGRALPRLGPIAGRSSDAVRLPDGTTIAGALGHIFDDNPRSIHQFEIVQDTDYSVTLRCIPNPDMPWQEAVTIAERTLRTALRDQVPLTVEIVDSIPQVGGKMRFIRSSAPK